MGFYKVAEAGLETKRQLIHLLNGSLIAFAVLLLKPVAGLWIILPLFLAMIVMNLAPKVSPKNRLLWILYRNFEREGDIRDFPLRGAVYFGYGIAFPIVLLDARMACATILILSWGDSASTLLGGRWGRIRLGEKSLEGFFGFVLAASLASSFIIGWQTALLFSFAGGLIELLPRLDDNLTIPSGLSLLALHLGL